MRIRVDPQRGFDRAAAIPGSRRHRLLRAPRHHLDETARQHLSDLVEPDIVAAIGGGLREFAQHHQFGQRRRCADPPDLGAVADRFHQFRRQEERQAFIAATMLMAADVFVAGMADQDRSRHQFERPSPRPAAEAALAHIGDRMAVDTAPRTACRPARRCTGNRTRKSTRAAAEASSSCANFSPAGAAGQPEAARRTGSCC